jgi:hypothetical protein
VLEVDKVAKNKDMFTMEPSKALLLYKKKIVIKELFSQRYFG